MILMILMKNKLKIMFLGSNFENEFWILEQPVNNKGRSSIQFLLREFIKKKFYFIKSFVFGKLESLRKFY